MVKRDLQICEECGKETYIGAWPWCPHEPIRSHYAQEFTPTVYFRSPDGKLKFPGRSDAKTPKGYERVEVTNFRERDQLYKEMNQKDKERYERHHEKLNSFYSEQEKSYREELRSAMRGMSEQGKALARAAMEESDRKGSYRQFQGNNYLEHFEYDASNREAYNDTHTEWKNRK